MIEEQIKQKLEKQKQKVKKFFEYSKRIYCPYFEQDIILNSEGYYHLRYSARRERSKKEQLLKFSLFPLAIKIIKKSGTLQEYRSSLVSVGKKSARNGLSSTKRIQHWAFVAINYNKTIKVRVVLRQIGDGNIIFWSAMPFGSIKGPKLYTVGIEDE